MAFNSLDFMILFAVTVILYYALPHKFRNPLLLIVSYIFYAAFDLGLTMYLVLCTLVTYFTALQVEKYRGQKSSKTWATIGVVANLAALAFYKYLNFIFGMIFGVLKASGIAAKSHTFKLLVPLGISFIVFSVVSYIIDVYRGKISAEKSLFKLSLFISFFPKVVQGPIERAGDILPQFDQVHVFDDHKFSEGMLMVLYGLFMKMVVADRASIVVDTIYGSLSAYSGAAIVFATSLFAIQIYCDFAGYSYVAIGAARILGFEFKRNFRQPYMSLSIAEFWRRWHISLNAWLRDYLYIPLGGNRCSPARKNLNSLIVFGVSGLWHGADWGYIIWGLLNAVYIMIENKIKSIKARITIAPDDAKASEPSKEGSPVKQAAGRTLRRILNFILISFTWIFFRAQDLPTAMKAITRIFGRFNFSGFVAYVSEKVAQGSGTLLYGLDVVWGLGLLLVCILVVVIVDVISDQHDITGTLARGNLFVRWLVYFLLIFAIIILGVYGYGFNAAAFIYAGF